MEQLLIIFDSLLFLLVGWFLGRHPEKVKLIEKIPDNPEETKKPNGLHGVPVKSGVIDYPSQADIDYTGSEEEKTDKERERIFNRDFTPNA